MDHAMCAERDNPIRPAVRLLPGFLPGQIVPLEGEIRQGVDKHEGREQG